MCMNIEIASIILEIFIVPEPATTSGTGLLLDRDNDTMAIRVQLAAQGAMNGCLQRKTREEKMAKKENKAWHNS